MKDEGRSGTQRRSATTRRDFLRRSALVSASGLLWACAPTPPAATPAPAKPAESKPAEAAKPAAPAATTAPAAPAAAAPATSAPAAKPAEASKPAAPAAAAKPNGTLTIAQGADTTSLDPQQTQASAPRSMMRSMFESLLIFDEELKIKPWLATSYAQVNPTTWELKLREDVTFHNGEKFTAEAVKWSHQRFVDPATKNIYANTLEPVTEVQIVNDYTVRMITKSPLPSLPATLATWLFMAPPKAMKEMGDEYFKKPIGTGPYKFVEWVPGERLVVEAAGPHFSGGPWVQKLVWRTITEPVARVTALKTGEADLITNVPPVQLSAVTGAGAEVVRSNGLGILVLMLNSSKGPLADKRVRQAMNYAIDKEKIVKGLFGGAAKPLNGPYNDLQEGTEPSAPMPYPYNPDKAKQLLAEAGFANGFKITIDTPSGRYLNDKQTAEAAAGDLAKVGIEMAVNPVEWGAMIKILQEKQSDLWLLAQNSLDTYALTSVCFHSKIKGIPWLGYNSPEADALIEKGGAEMDDKARIETFKKLRQLIVEDAPWVFLHASEDLYGVGPKVQGWKAKGDQVVYVYGTGVKS